MTTEEYRENAQLIRLAKEKAYKAGYEDAQSEVKDTAIAFAEWLWHNEWIETAQPPSGEDLYDLFLASQNKQLEDTDTILSHTENSI